MDCLCAAWAEEAVEEGIGGLDRLDVCCSESVSPLSSSISMTSVSLPPPAVTAVEGPLPPPPPVKADPAAVAVPAPAPHTCPLCSSASSTATRQAG